jgi:hypothetical protein
MKSRRCLLKHSYRQIKSKSNLYRFCSRCGKTQRYAWGMWTEGWWTLTELGALMAYEEVTEEL